MQKKIAQALSVMLHPLLMPALGIVAVFNAGTYLSYIPGEIKQFIFLIVFTCTLFLPLGVIPFFTYHKLVKNVEMESSKERIAPLFITFICYYTAYYFVSKANIPFISRFLLASSISVLLVMLISVKWKISAHTTGIGGIAGLVISLIIKYSVNLQVYFITVVFLAGLLGTVRLSLNAHKPSQIYAGMGLGFFTVLAVLILFNN